MALISKRLAMLLLRSGFALFLALDPMIVGGSDAATLFTTRPKDKEVFVGDTVVFDWDYKKGKSVAVVSFGIVANGSRDGVRDLTLLRKQPNGIVYLNPEVGLFRELMERTKSLDDKRASFKISNVRMNDTGRYFCTIHLNLLSVVNYVNLRVVDVKIDKDQSSSVERLKISQNRRFLRCVVKVAKDEPVTFTWFKNPNNKTMISRAKHNDVGTASVLAIVFSSDSDFTTYTCVAKTKRTTITHDILVKKLSSATPSTSSPLQNTETKPKGSIPSIRPLQNKTVTKGEPVRLVCNATGHPSPNVSWSKVGGSLRPYYVSGSVLVIPRAELTDTGKYICTARNTYGGRDFVTSVEAFVTVKLRPHSPVPLSTQITHLTIKVHWKKPESHGYPLLMYSIHRVELDRAGQEVTSRTHHVNEDVHEYEVGDIRAGRTYRFFVTAWNTHGESVKDHSKSMTVKVQKP